ncbi:MAG: hypothetical protein SVG88_09055 [Halobacteriales archaeon]|nr:hypothetical protein [Halobacteriales archaeon]
MSTNSSPESRIVDVLETAGVPLECDQLRERTELDRQAFDTALSRLRGQEVVRKLADTDAYRLTYWPESSTCIVCEDTVTCEDYYELELNANGTTTRSDMTGILHPGCARQLLDKVSISDR